MLKLMNAMPDTTIEDRTVFKRGNKQKNNTKLIEEGRTRRKLQDMKEERESESDDIYSDNFKG